MLSLGAGCSYCGSDDPACPFAHKHERPEPKPCTPNTPGANPTVGEALSNALEFLEAMGYGSGDVHDDLQLAIHKIQHVKGGRAILETELT